MPEDEITATTDTTASTVEVTPPAEPEVVTESTPAPATVQEEEPQVRLTSGKLYYLSDFYAKAGTPFAEQVKNRAKPRVMEEGDPLVRGFFWAGQQAFECRLPVQYEGPLPEDSKEAVPTWTMACCKTFFTLHQLSLHWKLEHDGEVLPEFET